METTNSQARSTIISNAINPPFKARAPIPEQSSIRGNYPANGMQMSRFKQDSPADAVTQVLETDCSS
ncbi:MAG: hypothetical protein KGI33_05170 [Thaumarchaeota archaeon]|nr:hypothetical protein [Nitrososphaerota archaeon]